MKDMLFGVCTPPINAMSARECGADFIECSFRIFAKMDKDEFSIVEKQINDAAVDVIAMNGMFPADMSFYCYRDDKTVPINYMKTGFERADALGTKTVVLGSGAARNIPHNINPKEADIIFSDILYTACELASNYGITIAIEPLREAETNYIHTISDAAAVIDKLPVGTECKITPDIYHMFCGGEKLSEIKKYGSLISHCHICSTARHFPKAQNTGDHKLLSEYVQRIRSFTSCREISIEGGCPENFVVELTEALEYLRTL